MLYLLLMYTSWRNHLALAAMMAAAGPRCFRFVTTILLLNGITVRILGRRRRVARRRGGGDRRASVAAACGNSFSWVPF